MKITYYDTPEHALTKNDIWLRKSGENWEVKIPAISATGKGAVQYQEIEGEDKIRQVFDVVPEVDFEKDIAKFGYAPFCVLEKKNEEVSFLDEKVEVIEYLKNKKPQHYKALAKAGILN